MLSKRRSTVVRYYTWTILASIVLHFTSPEVDKKYNTKYNNNEDDDAVVIDSSSSSDNKKKKESVSYCNITLWSDTMMQINDRGMSLRLDYWEEEISSFSEDYYHRHSLNEVASVVPKKSILNGSATTSNTSIAEEVVTTSETDDVCIIIDNQTCTAATNAVDENEASTTGNTMNTSAKKEDDVVEESEEIVMPNEALNSNGNDVVDRMNEEGGSNGMDNVVGYEIVELVGEEDRLNNDGDTIDTEDDGREAISQGDGVEIETTTTDNANTESEVIEAEEENKEEKEDLPVIDTNNQEEEEEGEEVNRVIVDYASKSAGALILEKSSNFKGTSHLLQLDNDKYAISPCDEEKKYVVIGLSEDILVKQVVLINYERYSSHVNDFQISGAQTYPLNTPKDWNNLGTFKALIAGGKQTFELAEPAWARYLKFRFLTHYGDEFYCTVSQIQVHGSTMLQGFHEQWSASEEQELKQQEEEGGMVHILNDTNDADTAKVLDTMSIEAVPDHVHVPHEFITTTATQMDTMEVGRSSLEQQQASPSTNPQTNDTSATTTQHQTQVTVSTSIEQQQPIVSDTGSTTDEDTHSNRTTINYSVDDAPQEPHSSTLQESDTTTTTKEIIDNPTPDIKSSSTDITSTIQEQPQLPINDEPVLKEDTTTEQTTPTPQTATTIPPIILSKLILIIPSAKCLETLHPLPHFKKNILSTQSSKTSSYQPNTSSNTASSTSNTIKMEPIFKTLTDEIKSLKMNQSIQDQYLDLHAICYNKVLIDLLLFLQKQEDRMDRIEEMVGTLIHGRGTSRIGTLLPQDAFASSVTYMKQSINILGDWITFVRIQWVEFLYFFNIQWVEFLDFFNILLVWFQTYIWLEKVSPFLHFISTKTLLPIHKMILPSLQHFKQLRMDWSTDTRIHFLLGLQEKNMILYFVGGMLSFLVLLVGILSIRRNSTVEEFSENVSQQDESTSTDDDNFIKNNQKPEIIEPLPSKIIQTQLTKLDEVSNSKDTIEQITPQKTATVTDHNNCIQPVSPPLTPIIHAGKINKDQSKKNLNNSTQSINDPKSRRLSGGSIVSLSNEKNHTNLLRTLSTKIKKKKSSTCQVFTDEEDDQDNESDPQLVDEEGEEDSHSNLTVVRNLEKSLDSVSSISNTTKTKKKKLQLLDYWKTKVQYKSSPKTACISKSNSSSTNASLHSNTTKKHKSIGSGITNENSTSTDHTSNNSTQKRANIATNALLSTCLSDNSICTHQSDQ